MHKLTRVGQLIDRSTDLLGRSIAYTIVIIMCLAVLEVMLRYVFNAPTVWVWVINRQLLMLIAMLVAASAFQHGYFIRLDLFTKRFPRRVKLISDYWEFLFSFTFATVVLWQGTKLFLMSLAAGELFHGGVWHPPMYPIKFFVPVAGFLLMVQAVANLIRRFSYGRGES